MKENTHTLVTRAACKQKDLLGAEYENRVNLCKRKGEKKKKKNPLKKWRGIKIFFFFFFFLLFLFVCVADAMDRASTHTL